MFIYHLQEVDHALSNGGIDKAPTFPLSPQRVAQKFHFSILRIEVTRASRGLSAIAELLLIIMITNGQSNLTKRPHRRRTRTVQSYSPCGANVHPHLTHASFGPPQSISQTASRLVQPFLHSSRQKVSILCNRQPLSLSTLPLFRGSGSCLIHFPWTQYDSNGMSIGSAVFPRHTIVTDRPTDRPCYSVCNNSRPHLRT